MLTYISDNNISDIKAPIPYLKNVHFTDSEIKWICKKNRGCSFTTRLCDARKFISNYPNLEDFTKYFNKDMFMDKTVRIPYWYVIKLVQYQRIKIDLYLLKNLRMSYNDVLYEESFLVDINLIKEFVDVGVNQLGYSESYIRNTVRGHFIKGIFYYGGFGIFCNNITEYKRKIQSSRTKEYSIDNIANILKHMGYEVAYDFNIISEQIITGDLLKNPHHEIRQAIEEYIKDLRKVKSKKSIKTVVSHLRIFFNVLYSTHPDINKLTQLSNEHIESFIKEQKNTINIQGKYNSPATINHRLDEINKMLNYFMERKKYDIKKGIISAYDKLKEPKTYTKYVSKNDISKVIKAVKETDLGNYYIQHKMALLIMIDTGRRIHEVLSLTFDCLKENQIYFHKTKHNKPGWQVVGSTTINAVIMLKEIASKYHHDLYSHYDELKKRRLFPSENRKGVKVLSIYTVNRYFNIIQIKNNIIDEKGKLKFTLKDNKKNFIACMLGAGVKVEDISKFLLQDVDSLVPYEVNNEKAIETLKKVEAKQLLMGKGYSNTNKVTKKSKLKELLNNVNIVKRHSINLITKINNPKETMPLALGYCSDNTNIETCGDLICLACEEFKTNSIEDFRNYTLKMYKHIYKFKRDKRIKDIEKKLLDSLEKAYENLKTYSKYSFKDEIKNIKKSVREEMKS